MTTQDTEAGKAVGMDALIAVGQMLGDTQQWLAEALAERDRLVAIKDELVRALDDLLELAVFMSGSADFSPEGQAYEGWRVLEGVDCLIAARDALASARSQEKTNG